MIHFVGAGPGAPDLITVRGKQYLEEADVIIYRIPCKSGTAKRSGGSVQNL